MRSPILTHMPGAGDGGDRGVFFFYNFMNGRGIQKSEELNRRGRKIRQQTGGVSKLSHEWNGSQNFRHFWAE